MYRINKNSIESPSVVVRDFKGYPDVKIRGESVLVLNTFANFKWLLEKISTEVKLIGNECEISFLDWKPFDEEIIGFDERAHRLNYLCIINGMPTSTLRKHIRMLVAELKNELPAHAQLQTEGAHSIDQRSVKTVRR